MNVEQSDPHAALRRALATQHACSHAASALGALVAFLEWLHWARLCELDSYRVPDWSPATQNPEWWAWMRRALGGAQ